MVNIIYLVRPETVRKENGRVFGENKGFGLHKIRRGPETDEDPEA